MMTRCAFASMLLLGCAGAARAATRFAPAAAGGAATSSARGARVLTSLPQVERVLVTFAHPDDAETICGGIVAQWVAAGTEVAYLVTTNGDKGWSKNYNMTSPLLAKIRQQEQLNAAAVLGVSNVTFLNQEDGRLEGVDPIELKQNITRAIRTFRPNIVLSFSPETDYKQYVNGLMHRDHQTTGRGTIDSVYPSARDYLAFPQLWAEGYATWDVPEIWLFAFESVGPTDVLVNITDVFPTKLKALEQHVSQYTSAADLATRLTSIGQGIAARNGFDPSNTLMEAYQVVTIL